MERVTGHRDNMSTPQQWTGQLLRGEPITLDTTDYGRDYTYVLDTGSAIATVVDAPELPHHLYNITNGAPVTGEQIQRTLAELFPETRIVESAAAEPEGSSLGPTRGPLSGYRLWHDLGWTPQYDLAAGLTDYVQWRRDFRFPGLISLHRTIDWRSTIMALPPDRIDYLPIVDRPVIKWPNDARVALWISPNIEHYEYTPVNEGVRDPWPRTPYPDVQQFAYRDYGNRVGFLADAGAAGQARHPLLHLAEPGGAGALPRDRRGHGRTRLRLHEPRHLQYPLPVHLHGG